MYSSDSERKHLPGMGESPNTSNYRKSTSRETDGVMFLMHSKLPSTHDRGPYYIGTNPLIWRANQCTGFYMTWTSVMKDLISFVSMFDCRYY